MICTTLHAREFAAGAASYVRDHLTHPGSDFHKKITAWLDGSRKPHDTDGVIALVLDHGEVVGWARTEYWSSGPNGADGEVLYDTLEAFVRPNYRLRGIAALAASALYASVLHDSGGTVAVFHPHMLLVARRSGFWPTLFEKDGQGGWRRV